tara:strand:- start:113 stop:358 length:246 start_codon:yes stop_codon:yes gene_type:complete
MPLTHNHRSLQKLGLEENDLSTDVTDTLLRAMQASESLTTICLDLQHGGEYSKVHTKEALMKRYTLAMLVGKKGPKRHQVA